MLIKIQRKIYHYRPLIYRTYCSNIEYFFTETPPSWSQHCTWWDNVFDEEDVYIIHEEDKYIGYIRVNKKTKDISIALDVEYQNRGYGSKAIKFFDHDELLVRCLGHNDRSIHFFAKNKCKVHII